MICRHVDTPFGARRGLAKAAAAPRCAATGASHNGASHHTNAAASATDATSAAPAAATASAAATAAAAAPGDLHATTEVFLVEEVEGGETDVGHFLFTERDGLTRSKVR